MIKNKIIMQIALGAVCIIFSACQKETIQPSNTPMQQVYYTQEGQAYIVKSITKYLPAYAVGVPPLIITPGVVINGTTDYSAVPNPINLNTQKSIIPISYSLSVLNGFTVEADILSTFYSVLNLGNGVPEANPKGHQAISKMLPLMDKIYYTDDNHYGYNVRYNQAVVSSSDFIDTNGNYLIWFQPSQADALSFQDPSISVAGASLNTCVIFTYFELQ